MTLLKATALDGFLRRPPPAVAALLVYGEEPGAVREVAARVVKHFAGSLDDPFSVVTLQDSDFSHDTARLADEVQSISMFGGNRAIWVRGAEQNFLKAVMPVLDGKISGNFVVAEAGVLAKSASLRTAFEKSPHGYIVPLYEADVGEIVGLVESVLSRDGLQIDRDAAQRFIELAGMSRGLVRSELEKLALYCQSGERVGVIDVEAVCGNDTGGGPDALVDLVFQGEVAGADEMFQLLVQSGIDAGRLLMVAHGHVLRLQDFRTAMERGMQAEQAIRSARPPIFFKRQRKVQAQLKVWSLSDLLVAGSTLGVAVLEARLNSRLSDAIANRCLLSLARRGLALQKSG